MTRAGLDKAYEPAKYEDKIYQRWLASGFFNPDNLKLPASATTYTIILPPPNITDRLHLGHVSMLAIEDLFIRYKRMSGFRTLWLPGTDHAAIATQTVVEKQLKAREHKTRHEIGRAEFLKRVWAFLNETQAIIINQLKKMGASLDWSRLAFTLDKDRQAAVKEMFVQMYEAGLLYRGERIVNWCPHCRSTLADDEVDYKEQTAKLYTFRYDKQFPIAIATTRPETKLGDTAVAVNPQDKRYKKYIGQTLTADFCGIKLKLKIISDRNVDMNFGTGALGVTPAHSMTDWQLAETNKLPIIKVIDEHGLIREGFGKFSGLKIEAAREEIIKKLKAAGLLAKTEEITNNLSLCYRCGTPLEPLPSKQWFVAVDKPVKRLKNKSLKQAAIEAVKKGEIKFLPERFSKRYLDWMNNLRDWCISRQIWFGHELPVYYKGKEVYVGRDKPKGSGWVQDQDTLDTWFSSAMWTFSTLGWPANFKNGKKSGDLAKFHPTQLMETGYEIITLWISRMIMMSLFAVGEIPFKQVYLHGMVLDKQGKKMSKSKGNGIDPLAMAKAYGADAVRLSLLIGTTPGVDFRMSEDKIASYRNFVNKFWNIARYIVANSKGKIQNSKPQLKTQNLTLADGWILGELGKTITEVNKNLEKYDFARAGERLENFSWNDLADWYLEIAKVEGGKEEILNYILNTLLKLWHPFMPFATEALWQEIYGSKSLLMVETWPKAAAKIKTTSTDMKLVQALIVGIRNARSTNKIAPAEPISATIYAGNKLAIVKEQAELIKKLRTGIDELDIMEQGKPIANAIRLSEGGVEIYLIAAVDPAKEKQRLEKEFVKLEEYITKLEAELDNRDFIAKAPAKLVAKKRQALTQAQAELAKLKQRLSEF
jgi:valyl-tRNA synthetase